MIDMNKPIYKLSLADQAMRIMMIKAEDEYFWVKIVAGMIIGFVIGFIVGRLL